ncbi:hypothetical protein JCM14036_08730 [Desulfotomaculum defluvii]
MLKKWLVLWVFLIAMHLPFNSAYAETPVAVDGRLINGCQSMLMEGQIMLPLRPIFEEAGYRLEPNIQNGVIVGYKGKGFVQIHLGQLEMILGQNKIKLSTIPQITLGKTYLGVQDICRILNLEKKEEPGLHLISLFHSQEMTEEGVISQLLAADRQMLRVEYFNNQEFLAEHQIAPSPKIKNKEELIDHLSSYWDETFIDRLWQEGSQNDHYIGFFSEGSIPLLYNKELNVIALSPEEARIHVLMPAWDKDNLTEFEEIIYTLQKNELGKLIIKDIRYQ